MSIFGVIFLMLLCEAFTQLQNSLMEQPRVTCEQSRIKMFIHTWLPFSGSVYAKGFFHKDICRVQGNGIGHTANITIPVSVDCGMRRRRNVNPHGLSLQMDAFHLECHYLEQQDQRLGNRLEISALPSTEIGQTLKQSQIVPKCRYQVLSSEKGEQISYAAIGQPIIHKWICSDTGNEDEGIYCLTVHSCQVDDGQGNTQKLLDENGCPLDDALFGSIEYKTDLEGIQRGNAFKFADRVTIYFNCQLRLELKNGWKECQRSGCAVSNTSPSSLENKVPPHIENQIVEESEFVSTVDASTGHHSIINTTISLPTDHTKNKSSSQHEFSSAEEIEHKEDKIKNYEKEDMIKTKIFKNRKEIEEQKRKKQENNVEEECQQLPIQFGLNDDCTEDNIETISSSLKKQRSLRSNEISLSQNLLKDERKQRKFWRNSNELKMDIEVNKAIDVFDLLTSQTGKEGISFDKLCRQHRPNYKTQTESIDILQQVY